MKRLLETIKVERVHESPKESGAIRRFELLDGLRGIAAICVALMHFCEIYTKHAFTHGYLAVDFLSFRVCPELFV